MKILVCNYCPPSSLASAGPGPSPESVGWGAGGVPISLNGPVGSGRADCGHLCYTGSAEWSRWLTKVNSYFHPSEAAPIMTKPEDNRPHLDISISDHTFTALLDTEATNSIVGAEGLSFLPASLTRCRRPAEMASINVANGLASSVEGVLPLRIRLGLSEHTVDFLIVPTVMYPFVLGANFCAIFQLSLHFLDFSGVTRPGPSLLSSEGIMDRAALAPSQTVLLEQIVEILRCPSSSDMGCVKTACHYIDSGDALAIKQQQYPLSLAMQKHLHEKSMIY